MTDPQAWTDRVTDGNLSSPGEQQGLSRTEEPSVARSSYLLITWYTHVRMNALGGQMTGLWDHHCNFRIPFVGSRWLSCTLSSVWNFWYVIRPGFYKMILVCPCAPRVSHLLVSAGMTNEGFSTGAWANLPMARSPKKEKWLSFLWQSSTAHSSLMSNGNYDSPSMLECWIFQFYAGLVKIATSTMSSWGPQPFHTQKTAFHTTSAHPLHLILSLPSLLWCSLNLYVGGWHRCPILAENSKSLTLNPWAIYWSLP